jgi:hypothetical protein
MRATAPAKLRQQHQRNKGNNASTLREMTPTQLRQQHQHNEDKEDAIATTTKTHQRCQHGEGDNASAAWATMPAR